MQFMKFNRLKSANKIDVNVFKCIFVLIEIENNTSAI